MSKIWRFELESQDTTNGALGLSHVTYQTDVPLAGTEPDAAEILDHILDHFSSSAHNMSKWTVIMKQQVKLIRARVREELDPTSGDIGEVAEEALNLSGGNGSETGDRLPSAMCIWLSYKTATASRSARGGTHLPPEMDADHLDVSGLWDSTIVTGASWLALAASILDPLDDVFQATGDINPVVYSRTRRGRSLSPYTFPITSVSISNRPRWLRRRER